MVFASLMLRTVEWSPDTCTCVIEYAYDDSVPLAQVTFVASRHVRKCVDHRNLVLSTAFDAVTEETGRVQKVRDRLLTLIPQLGQTILQLDGSSYVDFKPDRRPKISFDSNRVLTVIIPNITIAQRTTLQADADTRFGVGKVIVG